MGYSELQSQLMSVIVYAVTFFSIIGSSWVSDRLQKRGAVIMFDSAVACLGLILLLTISNNAGRLVAACVAAAGCRRGNHRDPPLENATRSRAAHGVGWRVHCSYADLPSDK